ncbi:Superfamily II DNA or RNA helicase, SNF2 family [Alteribacillus persepolensis]|uniref:Superfamily II DNA or RNA helicase, SNF2 family n=1 Tax=Alteribacillus persepolensis TaxID=568899 RepID=A0A1G8FIL8_9BACI|nr:DEAD/DEAH box helicase [Alteribacillus persepolensis]SDH81948.1 Superfamily II DNA or RNA helicase, SNF2 family [Alteribacillus persepolensis]
MRYLTKAEIQDLAGKTIFLRGLHYYESGNVSQLSFNTAGSFTKIKAVVAGTLSYHVQLLFHEDGELQEGSCSCPAYQEGMDVCKHMAAVLLSLAPTEQKATHKNRQHRQKVNKPAPESETEKTASLRKLFVDYFAGRMQTVESVGEVLETEFTLAFHTDYYQPQEQFFTIELRIGTDKLYVVKDIEALLTAMRQRSLLPFTKKFTFDPTYHYFEEADLRALREIESIIRNQRWSGRQTSFFYTEKQSPSEITVPPVAAENMLRALSDCSNAYIKPAVGNRVPFVIKKEWPGSFALHQTNRYYYLSYSSFEYPPKKISLTPFYIWNDRLYETNENDQQTMLLFHMLMDTPNGRLPLEKGELEQVYANVIESLNTQNRLIINNEITDQVEQHALHRKVYLERKNEALLAEPLFTYGPHTLHAVTEERNTPEKEAFIARETKKEEELLQVIESAGFHWNGEALSLTDEETIFTFFSTTLPELKDIADVFMTKDVEQLIVPAASISIESSLDESLGWLDVSFQTDDLNEDDLYDLMMSLKEKKRYHKTSDGRFISLHHDFLQNIQAMFDDTNTSPEDLENNRLRLPAYKAFQVDKYVNTGRQWHKDESVERLLTDIRSPETFQAPLPASLTGVLRDYQEKGFHWFKALTTYGFGGILADDMGLGKTLQTLTYILSERQERPDAPPFLVIAPSSLVYNWEKEAHTFTPELNVQIIHGSKAARQQQIESIEQNTDICITSYPLVRRDIDLYENVTFHGLILDEAQALKNYTSKTFRAVRNIQTEKAFALSGTPIENKIDELWSLFAILMPGLFPDVQSFKALSPDTIRHRVSPFILRRTKSEVLTELPDKIETTIHCDLTKTQRETYVAYLNRIKEETAAQLQTGTFQQNRMNILSNLTRLRQLCCHPGMFLEEYNGGSGKLEELMNFMKDAHENEQRVLIFSQFTSMLSIIRDAFDKKGISYYYLDGQTPSHERLHMTDQFNEGKKEAFLISLKAGGTGLNLTGADTVILFDLWWNPAVENQAADRAHRIGQTDTVQVMKMIAQGTIEEKIQSLQEKKKALFDQVIQSGETNLSSLSEEDIREILEL